MSTTERLSEEWARQIWVAQRDTTRLVRGKVYERIRFGREGRGWYFGAERCGDCSVARGLYHVPGCDLERCPACRGQTLTCGCGTA